MAGIVGNYNTVPRLREIVTNEVISPVLGSNPADLGQVTLKNVRGQVQYIIISGDNLFTSMFKVVGGFGEWPGDWSQNWYPVPRTEVNCSIRVLQENRLEITTPAADAGGRVYILNFVPLQSFGPNIRQISVNSIGNNTLTVRTSKNVGTEGYY